MLAAMGGCLVGCEERLDASVFLQPDADTPRADGGATDTGAGGADSSAPDSAAEDAAPPDAADFPDAGAPVRDAAPQPVDTAARDAGLPDADLPDAGPPTPPIGEAVTESPEALLDSEVDGVFALPDGGWLATDPDGFWIAWTAADAATRVELAGVRHALPLPDGVVLVAADDPPLALVERDPESGAPRVVRSPLSDGFVDAPVHALARTPGPDGTDLWLATSDDLRLLRQDRVFTVNPARRPTASARLALGPHPTLGSSLWVAAGDDVYALDVDGDDVAALSMWEAGPVDALAIDGTGAAWIARGTALVRRDPESRRWSEWLFETPIRALAAEPGAEQLWIATDAGLWLHRAGTVRPAPGEGIRALAADAGGAVLVASAFGVHRQRPGRDIALVGARAGDRLQAAREVEIRPSTPDRVTVVRAAIDDGAPAELMGPPWSVLLDPEALSDGAHRLTVAADWDDGASVTVELRFSTRLVGPPNWVDDVEPVVRERCSPCHGTQGFASRRDTYEYWRDETNEVLDAIRTERMPRPPYPVLDAAQIAVIEAWAEAGHPEGRR